MTDHSLVPKAAHAAGIDFEELVWRILNTSRTDDASGQLGLAGPGRRAIVLGALWLRSGLIGSDQWPIRWLDVEGEAGSHFGQPDSGRRVAQPAAAATSRSTCTGAREHRGAALGGAGRSQPALAGCIAPDASSSTGRWRAGTSSACSAIAVTCSRSPVRMACRAWPD
jgi:hypothetical protein